MWNEINNQEDVDYFMEQLRGFHDSCLKEMRYISGAYVREDLGMLPINDKRILRVIIQRQFEDPCAVELEFQGLKRLEMIPDDEKYDCIIFDAAVILKDDCIIWCDDGNLTEDDLDSNKGVVIIASKLRWRPVNEFIGNEEVYIERGTDRQAGS